jgi:hypothetical protein
MSTYEFVCVCDANLRKEEKNQVFTPVNYYSLRNGLKQKEEEERNYLSSTSEREEL